jgi:hypothetical protein
MPDQIRHDNLGAYFFRGFFFAAPLSPASSASPAHFRIASGSS